MARIFLFLLMLFPFCVNGQEVKPTFKDIPYGEHELQKLDIYLPDTVGPYPYVIDIHGGGWWNGDKKWQSVEAIQRILSVGCAYVAINYRCLPQAAEAGAFPPVRMPYHDARYALQFTRCYAARYNLDPEKVALHGSSAGGCTALWLALSPDMAEKFATDTILRISTQVLGVGVEAAQTSLDPKQMRKWVGKGLCYGGHAFGLLEADFDTFLARRKDFKPYFKELSPAALVNRNSPPIYLSYDKRLDRSDATHEYCIHSPFFGVGFQRLAQRKGAICYLSYPGFTPQGQPEDVTAFLIQILTQ